MSECHSTTTPVDARMKLSATDGSLVTDLTHYRCLVGALQYLTLTRPGTAYAVSKSVCLCMTRGNIISHCLRGFFIMSRAHSLLVFISVLDRLIVSPPTRMLTGPVVQILDARPRVTVSILVTTWCLSLLNGRPASLAPAPRRNTGLLHTLLQRHVEFVSCSRSSTLCSLR